jgi:glycosyltransferase involved in cell wall biosynthesis
MNIAPVILFAYNRAEHLAKTINALAKCELAAQSRVIVIIDGPKNEEDRRKQERMILDLDVVSGFARVEVRTRKINVLSRILPQVLHPLLMNMARQSYWKTIFSLAPFFCAI